MLDFVAADRLPRRTGDRRPHLRPRRPDQDATGAGAAARDAAPEREAVGSRRLAGRRRARAEQPALGGARPRADAARRVLPTPRSPTRRPSIGKAAERCARIVKTFLAMARQQPARTSNVTVDGIIVERRRGGRLLDPLLRHRPCRSISSADLPAIWADPDQLSQVLINLLVNAEQALHGWEGQRRIVVSARFQPRQQQDRGQGHRHRPRNSRGDPAAHLRALLHHQGGRLGHRHRPVVLPPHRAVAWRHDPGRNAEERRHGIRHLLAGVRAARRAPGADRGGSAELGRPRVPGDRRREGSRRTDRRRAAARRLQGRPSPGPARRRWSS